MLQKIFISSLNIFFFFH